MYDVWVGDGFVDFLVFMVFLVEGCFEGVFDGECFVGDEEEVVVVWFGDCGCEFVDEVCYFDGVEIWVCGFVECCIYEDFVEFGFG